MIVLPHVSRACALRKADDTNRRREAERMEIAPKIAVNLWYDKEAREAAQFYVSAFKGSRIMRATTLDNTPSGAIDLLSIDIAGHEFTLMSAGPLFKINPSISFFVECASADEVDALWEKLSDGGTALMELGAYPFSERYGWLQDRYGVSWQVIYVRDRQIDQPIVPSLLFVGAQYGNAEAAIKLYTSVFPHARIVAIDRYGKGEAPDKEGAVKYGRFSLAGRHFVAMESAYDHNFAFNEAVSFIVHCDTQDEIDYYWSKLSAVPEEEQCGWLKDRFGVSWQIVPVGIDEMMATGSPRSRQRATEALLAMKKIDMAALKKAHEGR